MEFQREPLPDHQLPGVVMAFLLRQGDQPFSTYDLQRTLEEAGATNAAQLAQSMLRDLVDRGLLVRNQSGHYESRLPRAFGGGGGRGGDGGGNGNTPEGEGDPARGLREVLSHPYLLSYAAEDFDAALSNALTRIER
jgi:hypothetical protein